MSLTLSNSGGNGSLTLSNNGGLGGLTLIKSVSLVTNGLTLRLDAGNPASYDGSGSIWRDISGTEQNIELVNSPTWPYIFAPGTLSYFTFNALGSNQFGIGNGAVLSSTAYTKSVWFRLDGYDDNNLVSSDTGGHFMYMAGTSKLYNGHSNWGNYQAYPSTADIILNTWYNATLTFNTTDGMVLYLNGLQDSTYTAEKTAHGGDSSTNIATFGGGNLLTGRIAKVYCYDRSLTSEEVLHNYNFDKAEFGL